MKNNQDNKKNKTPQTTGHSWDNIEEYNTPAPRWWLIVWIITIIWAIIYWFFFPTWPTIKGHTKGINNWSSQSQLKESNLEIEKIKEQKLDKFRSLTFKQVLNDPNILEFALNGGKAAFKENCAACHGTGGSGFKGFPNLNDDDWLWGSNINDIYTTLLYGIRSGHEETRDSQMPAFGIDETLSSDEIKDVAQYVKSLSDKKISVNKNGKKLYAQNCAVCHGKNGKGDKTVGAPNLSDFIWLYGDSMEEITTTIHYSRKGVMPYWKDRLDDDTIRQLTLYVYSLGGATNK